MRFTALSQLSRGAVVLIPFPFTDLTGTKLRPALLISDPAACPGSTDGHFVFLSSKQPPAHVPIVAIAEGTAEARSMGLRYQTPGTTTNILPLKIATLDVSLVHRRIGTAPANVLADVTAHLARALGC